jgi:hypothetical protein
MDQLKYKQAVSIVKLLSSRLKIKENDLLIEVAKSAVNSNDKNILSIFEKVSVVL